MTRERLLANLLTAVLGSREYACDVETSPTLAFGRFTAAPPVLTVVDLASLGREGVDLLTDVRLTDAAAAIVAVVARGTSLESIVQGLGVTDIVRRDEDMRQLLDVVDGVPRPVVAEPLVLDAPIRVVVADDDEATRQLLHRVLTRHGYRVFTAVDGAEAIRCLEGGDIDLLFLDLQMPRLGGMAVLRWLEGRASPPRTVIVSAIADRGLKLETLKLGAFDYLEKPVTVDRLLVTASTALALDPARSRAVWKPWVRKQR